MSANEKNTGMLLDKIQSLPEDVQMKIGYMIEGAALVASSRPQPTDPNGPLMQTFSPD